MSMSPADQVWNRACMDRGGRDPRAGDLALAAMIRLHSRAMSGGLLDAVESRAADEIAAAVAGYRYFALDDAAGVVEWLVEQIEVTDLDDDEEAGNLESESDARYAAVVQDDSVLTEAFKQLYERNPAAFTPMD